MLDAYRDVVRSRLARRVLVLTAVSAPPRDAYPIALVLFARQATGSYGAAGVALGASTVAAALTMPLRGWIVDRLGIRTGVPALALARTAGLLGLVLAGRLHVGAPAIVGLATLTGTFGSPPVPTALASQTLELPLLRATLGLQMLLDAATTTAGDLAVGAVALLASPSAVLLLVVALTALQGIVFLSAPGAPTSGAHAHGRPRAPGRRLRAIAWTALPLGAVLGLLDVIVPAFAREHHAVAAAGPIYAALGLGVALGALADGAVRSDTELWRRYARQWALATVACAPLLLAGSIASFTPLLALVGLLIGPLENSSVLLVRELASGRAVTEAMSWVAAGGLAGVAIGGALAGLTIDALGVGAALALIAACPLIGWAITLGQRSHLRGDTRPEAS
jgi:MFS family permease